MADSTFKVVTTMAVVGEQSGNVYRKTTDEELDLDPNEVIAFTGKIAGAIMGAITELAPAMMGVAPVTVPQSTVAQTAKRKR